MEGYRRGSEDVIEGEVVAKGSSRQANFVAPAPVALRPATPPARVVVEPFDLSTAFESRPVTVDPDGAKGRAILFAVRGTLFLVVFLILMVAAAGLAAFAGLMNWDMTFPLWVFGLSAAATLVTLGVMLLLDYQHSPAGVERFKVRRAADLAEREVELKAELYARAIEGQLELLRRGDS